MHEDFADGYLELTTMEAAPTGEGTAAPTPAQTVWHHGVVSVAICKTPCLPLAMSIAITKNSTQEVAICIHQWPC